MPDLNSLGLKDEPVAAIDFANLRTTMGMIPNPPQPGIYLMRLPSAGIIQKCFEIVKHNEQGERLGAKFMDEAMLINETLNDYYGCYISNATREVGKQDDRYVTSDMAMLLKVVNSIPIPNARGIVTNSAYGNALIAAAGKTFKIDHSLTGNCNDKREVYRDGAVQPGSKGCGLKWAVEGYKPRDGKPEVLSIPKGVEEGTGKQIVLLRWVCGQCQAEIRAFGQIRGFKAAE